MGERRRLYWATSPVSGWKIVLNIPEDEILIPVRELTLRSALVGVAGLLVLVLLVTAIARRFSHPLLGLTRTAAAIEQGKFREEMLGDLPEHRDEMGELARSFRKMAREIQAREQSLAELNQNLERTVAQRTGGTDRARGRTGETDAPVAGTSRPGVEPLGAQHQPAREFDRRSSRRKGAGRRDRIPGSARRGVVCRRRGRGLSSPGRARLSGQRRPPEILCARQRHRRPGRAVPAPDLHRA